MDDKTLTRLSALVQHAQHAQKKGDPEQVARLLEEMREFLARENYRRLMGG